MPYVKRDDAGRIAAIYGEAQTSAYEFLAPNSKEIQEFIDGRPIDETRRTLEDSDLAMGRVVEDLIDVLIAKNVILLTDLPQPAQEKIMNRRHLRGGLEDLADLVAEVAEI